MIGRIENGEIKIEGDIDELVEKGYGIKEGNYLKLKNYEALYLLFNGKIEIFDDKGNKIEKIEDFVSKFLKEDPLLMIKYLIYRDIRSKGYVIREGYRFGNDFRVYERGKYDKKPAKYIIYGIFEGQVFNFGDLTELLRHTQALRKTLILAVVDRRTEVVYYTVSKLMV